MTNQLTYPRIIIPEGLGNRIHEIESKERFRALVELENGNRYILTFYESGRLGQDLDFNVEQGKPWLDELNVIVIPRVTLEAAQQCVQALWHNGFFDDLKPKDPHH
jgi:hypothetical protein